LWDELLDRSIARTVGGDANAIVDDVFADVTAILRQRTGCTLGEAELMLADARSRADQALGNCHGAYDANVVDIDDATDAAVATIESMLNPEEQP
jgi:hypothetical protein